MALRATNYPAIHDLVHRYGSVLVHAWRNRAESDTPTRLSHELAFLPAQLELTESPPHPAPLWTARLLMGIALTVVTIVAFGQLDIVAVAPGQLIPIVNMKVIQSALTGVVKRVLVQNGERVTAGQLLVELDTTQATADTDKAKTSRIDAQLTVARAQALLRAQEKNMYPRVDAVPGASVERQADTQHFAEEAFREYRQKASTLEAEYKKRDAELATTQEEIGKLQQTSPIARRQAADYEDLASDHYVSSHEYQDKERIAIEQTRDLAAATSRSHELEAGLEEQRRDIEATMSGFRREQWEILNKSAGDAAQNQDEETKADARQGLLQLKSPVAGVVEQLNVHTVGGVVTTAQPLMEIVPDDALEVEARVSNKDIGFVSAGQSAIVKVSTFPYTRFGYVNGTVVKVSNDAISDKKQGMVFLARVRMPSNRFKVENKWINLSPGMEVTTEIKTGRQRVWQYFLSPLLETGSESLRER